MSNDGFTVVVFVTRKPDLSPDAFQDYWENHHVPLLRRLGGSTFPRSHIRHYLKRDSEAPGFPAAVVVGEPSDCTYDGFAIINFESEAAFREFLPVMSTAEVSEDEHKFTDPSKMRVVVLGGVRKTTD
ncbi:EthD domain-containing protein [Aspergillus pseudonomiae]|uniref:EthD domain-containing protein n=1 Tax=Aspergillus pseudonomiae TaxID=1506151 RepID=A0A5N7D3H4_9EURO|nr:EthD domain-containing protein [Aspergillus pseudonomiae]KAE8400789.1 EthD domain-containing protein [Aspergillus pseudonomiae]